MPGDGRETRGRRESCFKALVAQKVKTLIQTAVTSLCFLSGSPYSPFVTLKAESFLIFYKTI